jgi:hypothetical protein
MLSLLRRKPKPESIIEQGPKEPMLRNRQQNIKVSDDCSLAFAAIAEAQGLSKAALFEDLVAERLEILRRRGFDLGGSKA